MKFSYNWLKELAGFRESPEKLAEFLTLRVFEVESVIKKNGDWALDIKLLPNRAADAAGHMGMAREIATLRGTRYQALGTRLIEGKSRKVSDVLGVKIESPNDCARYTARVMTGVKVGPSPKWMKERLEVCGIQSINNIVDAANSVMLETGQPLHVFDYERLKTRNLKPPPDFARAKSRRVGETRKTIIVRRARKGEKLLALDEKTYSLSPEILVIADEREPIAIAGIKGGKASGVSASTKAIILESANFDPVRTRIAAKLLNLKTDASYRFERGMDPNQTAAAVDRLAALIQEVASGEIRAGRVDEYPRPPRPVKILLQSEYVNRLIGETIPAGFIESNLKRLGWSYEAKLRVRGSLASYAVKPPTERRDIQIEEDVIEEIVRLRGYERVNARPPKTRLAPAAANEERQWENRIKDILVGTGFTEAYVYSFVGGKVLDDFDASADELLELENPTSPATQYLGAHPAQQYLELAAENLRRHERIAVFGIAKGFKRAAKPALRVPAEERTYLLIVKAAKGARDETFYEVKGALDHLFDSLGIAEHWYDDALTKAERQKTNALHPYRTAKVMADSEFLGIVAELHPTVQQRLKSKARLVFAQIDFDKLRRLARAEAEFRPIGKYPAVIRDVAVIVPEDTKADDVEGVIQNAGGALLADSDLFDYFESEELTAEGKKSLAFHLVFQSPERTLTDGEVSRLLKKIVSSIKSQDWEVRE